MHLWLASGGFVSLKVTFHPPIFEGWWNICRAKTCLPSHVRSLHGTCFFCLAFPIHELDVQDRWIWHWPRLQHVLQHPTMRRRPGRSSNTDSLAQLPRPISLVLALHVVHRLHRGKPNRVQRQRLLCCQVPPSPISHLATYIPTTPSNATPSPCSANNLTIRNGPFSTSPVLWAGCGTSFPASLMSMTNKVFQHLLALLFLQQHLFPILLIGSPRFLLNLCLTQVAAAVLASTSQQQNTLLAVVGFFMEWWAWQKLHISKWFSNAIYGLFSCWPPILLQAISTLKGLWGLNKVRSCLVNWITD